jgi:hypothetical protein
MRDAILNNEAAHPGGVRGINSQFCLRRTADGTQQLLGIALNLLLRLFLPVAANDAAAQSAFFFGDRRRRRRGDKGHC